MEELTPNEKAIELVDSFMDISEEQEYNTPRYLSKDIAKQCALRTVDQLIDWVGYGEIGYDYWTEVKEEIEKI